jgi:hypothetical protein
MEKRIALAGVDTIVSAERFFQIHQIGVILGMLPNPLDRDHLHRREHRLALGFCPSLTEELSDLILTWIKHVRLLDATETVAVVNASHAIARL